MNENGIISRIIVLHQRGFFLEIFFAFIVLSSNLKKRKYYWMFLPLIIIFTTPFYFIDSFTLFNINYAYFVMVILSFISGIILYKEKALIILITSVGAFALQHFSWNVLGIIYDFIPNVSSLSDFWLVFIEYFSLAVLYLITYIIFKIFKVRIFFNKNFYFTIIIGTLIVCIALIFSQLIESWTYIYRLYSSLLMLLALLLLYLIPYISRISEKEKEIEVEKNTLENLVKIQAKQNEVNKETQELINLKFHDMKNLILLFKENKNNNEQLNLLSEDIDKYTTMINTGNHVVDIVIEEKSRTCLIKKIRFTYIIDGSLLDFMKDSDIVSLIGNIMDNAIEALDKEDEKNKLIKLKIERVNNFIKINEENYTSTLISIKNNEIQTSKNDKKFHGFGLKSIKYIANKYNGDISLKIENNEFCLMILIPLNSK